ncbi:MAG: class I SAM-dependent methyltransferase [Nannocystaceae bacterium]|nr:class I SAM-dependent methyltransferase [Nannocystaceae bacterium]
MDLRAALYTAVHGGTTGDRGFYTDVCRGARSVLEFGCGGGRLLGVLAGSERRVVGVDHDEGLLALAQTQLEQSGLSNRVTLRLDDMRRVDLGQRFDRVVLAFNGLWCLPDDTAVGEALRNAATHLAEGGRLALDVYRVDAFHNDAQPDDVAADARHPVATVEVDGTTWEVTECSTWRPDRREIEARYTHEAADGRTLTTTIEHHYLLEDEVVAAIQAAGLPHVHARHGLAADDSLLIEAWR